MMYRKNVLRPGMTAIVAVLALSSTPSLAQDAATAVDLPPPVAMPEPAAPEPVAAPAPEPAATEIAPVAVEPSPTTAAPARAATATAPVRRAAAPARRPAASSAVIASAPAAAPAAEVPPAEAATMAAPVEAAVPAPIPVQQVADAPAEASPADDMLPIAGAAGIGVLALVGGAVALNRRRRRDGDVGYEPETIETDHVAPAAPEPVPAMPLAARAVPAQAAAPAGLDLSRFGRHTQAAYRGPTPDNPSLSLKRRLKRAAFFDGRERMAARGAPVPETTPMSAAAGDAVTAKAARPAEQPAAPAFAPRRTARPVSQSLFGFQQPAFQN